jgi:hypothetical protein
MSGKHAPIGPLAIGMRRLHDASPGTRIAVLAVAVVVLLVGLALLAG